MERLKGTIQSADHEHKREQLDNFLVLESRWLQGEFLVCCCCCYCCCVYVCMRVRVWQRKNSSRKQSADDVRSCSCVLRDNREKNGFVACRVLVCAWRSLTHVNCSLSLFASLQLARPSHMA